MKLYIIILRIIPGIKVEICPDSPEENSVKVADSRFKQLFSAATKRKVDLR